MADIFIPSPLKSVPIRPLTGGIVRNSPAHHLKPGQFYNLKNYLVTPEGLYRRPGTSVFYNEYDIDSDMSTVPIVMASLWSQTGRDRRMILLSSQCGYLGLASEELSRLPWIYEDEVTFTVDATGTLITGGTKDYEKYLLEGGDFVQFYDSDNTSVWTPIVGVVDSSTIAILDPISLADSDVTGTTVGGRVARSFAQVKPYLLDYVVTSDPMVSYNELIVASADRPLAVYDQLEGNFVDFITDDSDTYDASGGQFKAACVVAFMERLWVGHTVEYSPDGLPTDEGDMRHRLRWSSPTNKRDFSDNNYIDLPYMNGDIIRLVPLGNTLVVYANDAIYIGTPTTQVDMPLSFQQVDTGGQGLVGPRAIAPWLGGHFFVGQDDIYFLSMEGPRAIGSPVVRQTIRVAESDLWRTYVAVDAVHKQIVFGFPQGGGQTLISDVWTYSYETQAWARCTFPGGAHTMIANPVADNLGIAWDGSEVAAVTWDTFDEVSETWDGFKSSTEIRTLYIEDSGGVLRLTQDKRTDSGASSSGSISTLIETGDFDGNAPDTHKTFTRLSVKTEDIGGLRADPLELQVQGSVTGGRSWKQLGTIEIPADKDEGYVNFRLSGSMVRFRLRSTSAVDPHVITGFVVKARSGGGEFSLGTTDVQ